MTNILTARKEAAKIIHTKLKFLYYIKEVRRLIMKEEENFCIVSKIKNVKKLMMQVFVKDEKIKNFEFEYCKIRYEKFLQRTKPPILFLLTMPNICYQKNKNAILSKYPKIVLVMNVYYE